MSTVKSNAAAAASSLLGTINVAATSLSTGVQVIGDAFGVAGVKSASWLQTTRVMDAGMRLDRNRRVSADVRLSIVSHVEEVEKALASKPAAIKAMYDELAAEVDAAIAAASA